MTSNLDLRVSLEEMHTYLQHQHGSIEAYKATARSLLSAASLIVALTAALQLFSVKIEPSSIGLYNLFIVSAIVLYVALIACCVGTLFPVTLWGPIEPTWKVLRDAFVGKDDREILKMRLSGLLNAISHNSTALRRPGKLVKIASWLLPFVVVLLFGLSLIPRVS